MNVPQRSNAAPESTNSRSVLNVLRNGSSNSRKLILAAIAAGSLTLTACGGDDPKEVDSTGGTGGSGADGGMGGAGNGGVGGEAGGVGGTGGVVMGGNGGTGGVDECYLVDPDGVCDPLYICEDDSGVLMAQDVTAGNMGTYTRDLTALNADAKLKITIDDNQVINENADVLVVRNLTTSGYQPKEGESHLTALTGVNVNLIDKEDPFNENCTVKEVALGGNVRMEFTNVFAEVLHEKNGVFEESGSNGFNVTVDTEGTKVDTQSFSNFILVNNEPVVPANSLVATKLSNGKVRVTLTPGAIMDEGVALDPSLMSMSLGSQSLVQVGSNVWETEELVPNGPGVGTFRVFGANATVQKHMSDNTEVDVMISEETTDPCEGVDYDDGNVCNGVETCDPQTGGMVSGQEISCGDHGNCTEPAGDCTCTDGYTGDACETAPNTAPEFPSTPTVNPNPTNSFTPVIITVPVSDSESDDVAVNLSFNGDAHGCTFNQDQKVVMDGNGNAVFTMTPELGNRGNVFVQIDLDDGNGGVNGHELAIEIQ